MQHNATPGQHLLPWQAVQRELWEAIQFESVDEAERGLATFFADYNHRRAHMGIGSLVPADRFYGRWPEVIAEMDAVSRRRRVRSRGCAPILPLQCCRGGGSGAQPRAWMNYGEGQVESLARTDSRHVPARMRKVASTGLVRKPTTYLLSGLLHCAQCSAPMSVSAGSNAAYYRCQGSCTKGACP